MTARWCGHVSSDWPMPQTRMSPEALDRALRNIGKAHEVAAAEDQLAEIRSRWAHVPRGERPRLTITDSSSPGVTINALSHAAEDVAALFAEIDRLTAENDALTADLAVPGEGDQC